MASLVALAGLGCAEVEELDLDTAPLISGTPGAVSVVRFVNEPATTFEVLDGDVPLDRRAAQGLIAGRPFADIVEVDDVSYVGPAALERLRVYAEANGFVPEGDDLLGVYDGVLFTVVEADRALDLVNNMSDGVLHLEVGLDPRAVDSIVTARPILSMSELAELYYVGTAMLGRIKDYTAPPAGPVNCRHHGDCTGDDQCIGKPLDGSSDYGICRDLTPVAGEGDYCNSAVSCTAELFCGGVTVYGEGSCRPLWMRDTFASTTQRFIPLETTVPVATSVTVRGQASVPEDIEVDIDLRFSEPHSLRIAVRDPNGDEAVVWDGPSESGPFPGSFVVVGGISRDDQVNGRWLLRIWNPGGEGLGTLGGWTLDISSRWD